MTRLRVGIIGAGYWGPNLIRNFGACPLTDLVAVCDTSPERLSAVTRRFAGLMGVGTVEELLALRLDAVAIATPVSTHFAIASQCLRAGLHVMVEKPMTATVAEATALVALAAEQDRVLMVDHTYLFSPAIRRIKQLIDGGELGDLYYIDSVRINLGLFQHDINVIWDLAPHDLSIFDYILGREPKTLLATGGSHAEQTQEDIAYLHLGYDGQLLAHIHVNWLSPVKVRQMIFAGSKKSLVFNELDVTEPIKVYDRGVTRESGENRSRLQIGYRTGDVWSPYVEPGEALQSVVAHFADCIRQGRTPRSDGQLGLRLVRLLEAAGQSLRANSRPLELRGSGA